MKNTSPWTVRALSRLLVMVMALAIGFGPAATSYAQAVDPVARGLAAKANTTATAGAATADQALQGTYNFNAQNTRLLADLLARSKANAGKRADGTPMPARILFGPADSLGAGAWAGATYFNGPNRAQNLVKYSPAGQLQEHLAAAGYDAIRCSWFGDQNLGLTDFKSSDPRLSLAAEIGLDSIQPLAGHALTVSSGTSPSTFTCDEPVNTYRVWYLRTTGSMKFQIGSETATDYDMSTFVSGNASSIQAVNFTSATAAVRAFTFQRNSGTATIVGIEAWDSTKSQIQVVKLGWVSATAAFWISTQNPYSPLPSLQKLAADPNYAANIFLLDLGTNEQGAAVPVATYKANMLTLVDTLLAASSNVQVYLIVKSDISGDDAPYQQALYEIAASRNLPLIDLLKLMPTYEQMTTYGWYWDFVHGTRILNIKKGEAIYKAFMRLN